jgi:tRNA (cmo5U34)-methyltransferase
VSALVFLTAAIYEAYLMDSDNLETANAPESGRWTFDGDVTNAFSSMLEKSIPNLRDLRKLVTDVSAWLLDKDWGSYPGPFLVDLGSSRGDAVSPILDKYGARARYVAVEESGPMLEVLRDRFSSWGEDIFRVVEHDLRYGYPPELPPANVILSVLILQFVPIEYRQGLLRGIYEGLRSGGGFIVVEKVLGEAAESDRLLLDIYHEMKREAGYTEEAIMRKALSLEGVLVPLTAKFDEELFRSAGFDLVEQAWAYANFRCWICLRR